MVWLSDGEKRFKDMICRALVTALPCYGALEIVVID